MRTTLTRGLLALALAAIALPAWAQTDNYRNDNRNRGYNSSDEASQNRDASRRSSASNRSSRDRTDQQSSQRSSQRSGANEARDTWTDTWGYEKSIPEAGVFRASDLIGMSVRNGKGENLGTIDDIVVDLKNHELRYAALAYGGVLGMGEKNFAVPLDALKLQKDQSGNTFFLFNVEQEDLTHADGFENQDHWPAQASSQWNRRSRGSSQERGGQSQTFTATFYDFDGDRLVIRDHDGQRRSYHVAPGIRVTQQGERIFLDDLNEGDQLRLTYNRQGEQGGVLITAVDDLGGRNENGMFGRTASRDSARYGNDRSDSYNAQASYEEDRASSNRMASRNQYSGNRGDSRAVETVSGQLVSADRDEIAVRTNDGRTHRFRIGDRATVSIDGDDSYDARDLTEGEQVRLQVRDMDGNWTATRIEAGQFRR